MLPRGSDFGAIWMMYLPSLWSWFWVLKNMSRSSGCHPSRPSRLCVFESILDNLSITGAFFSALVAKNKSDLGMSLQKLPQEVKDLKLFFQKYDLNRNGRPLRQTAKDEVDSQGALVFNWGAHVAQPSVVVLKMCFVQYCSVISAICWFIFPSQMRWMRTQLTNDHYDVASTFKTLPVESRSCLGEEKEATLFTVWDAAFGYLCGTCGPAFFYRVYAVAFPKRRSLTENKSNVFFQYLDELRTIQIRTSFIQDATKVEYRHSWITSCWKCCAAVRKSFGARYYWFEKHHFQ